MTTTPLPPLPRTNVLYLLVLFVLAIGFYLLLFASLAAICYALYQLVLWTPQYLRYIHTRGGLYLLGLVYLGVGTVGLAILRGLMARSGGAPGGYRSRPAEHPKLFALLNEVAERVQARPIQEVYITPGESIGVTEEAAIYLPPGLGKRILVLGMGALNFLTVDQLRSVLAHEYGHFSNRDLFFGRFIYRVHMSYGELIEELGKAPLYWLNPLYWVLAIYFRLYALIESSFSRLQEFRADRIAVEAYGRQLFGEMLPTVALESSFFSQVGMAEVWERTQQHQQLPNVYHYVAVMRRAYEREHPDRLRKILSRILARQTRAFDSHPSLRERLRAQNIPTANLQLPPAAHPVPVPHLDAKISPDLLPFVQSGPASAAEELFGADAVNLQNYLSEQIARNALQFMYMLREAQREG